MFVLPAEMPRISENVRRILKSADVKRPCQNGKDGHLQQGDCGYRYNAFMREYQTGIDGGDEVLPFLMS